MQEFVRVIMIVKTDGVFNRKDVREIIIDKNGLKFVRAFWSLGI